MVYVVLVVLLTVLYLAVVTAGGLIVEDLGATILAAAVIAVVFAPLRHALQGGIERLLYGHRRDPYRALTELGERLDAAPVSDAESVLLALLETVVNALRVGYAAVRLPGADSPAAQIGEAPEELHAVRLSFHGLDRGELIVGVRPGEPWSPEDLRILTDLGRQAGALTHAVQLGLDLQRSREDIVGAREEERRRLRRELHDGLGPNLAAIRLRLDQAREMVSTRPEEARDIIASAKTDVSETLENLRRVVYELRPPSLDELGLVAALREQASTFSLGEPGRSLDIRLDIPQTLPDLPAAVEVAIYRIVTEALNNIVRHAAARTCWVRITGGHGLSVVVEDDGCGVAAAQRMGVGIRSMNERAAELGGTCRIEPRTAGGTAVRVFLPHVRSNNYGV